MPNSDPRFLLTNDVAENRRRHPKVAALFDRIREAFNVGPPPMEQPKLVYFGPIRAETEALLRGETPQPPGQ